MRGNIDAWWPYLEQGAEALVVTASGCGVVVKEYGYHLRNDPLYAEKAQRISSMTRDLSEILAEQDLSVLRRENRQGKIAFHAPCSLQHGLKINSVVESILTRTGFTLTTVADSHLCCGSAGTYSLLQSELSQRLLTNKVKALESEDPEMIATANIGCLHHIAQGSDVPVRHWIELLD